jgi:hypothetical protein
MHDLILLFMLGLMLGVQLGRTIFRDYNEKQNE